MSTMADIKSAGGRIAERFESYSLRERALIGATLLALTWALWLNAIDAPITDQRIRIERDIQGLIQEFEARESFQRDRDTRSQDPVLMAQREALQERIALQTTAIDESLLEFVDPQDVPVFLEDVLTSHAGLTLVELQSLPVVAVVEARDTDDASGPIADPTVSTAGEALEVWGHPVRLTLEGGYLDALSYLQALEDSDWQLSWRSLALEVVEHPKARIVIELETLSRHMEWFGV